MIEIYYKSKTEKDFRKPDKFVKGSWVYVENPNSDELTKLAEDFKLDFSLLKDAMDPYEVPRYEEEDDIKYFYLRFANSRDQKVETTPLLVAIGDDFVLTLCRECPPIKDKLLKSVNINTTQKTKFLIQILLFMNREFKSYINSISKNVKNLSHSIERIGNKEIARFLDFERMLNDFLSSLIPSNIILENILYGKVIRLYEEDAELIEDVSLSNTQLIEMCKATLKHIVNTREAYNTILTNNLNKTIKFLTSITIILTIPTIISSFYGMNVALPLQESPVMFIWLVLITLGVSFGLLFVFFKNKLL